MMRSSAVIALFTDLSEAELSLWVARNWVIPAEQDGEPLYAPADLARIRLIHDLHRTMAVPEETLPLVLSLLDQVHTLHFTLETLATALHDQPPEIQAILRATLDRRLP